MFCICNSSEALVFDQAKITLKIVGEQQKPIENANVKIGFEVSGRKGPEYNMFEGITKAEGVFSASAACNSHVGFTITKAGYYEGDGKYDFATNSSLRWEPWNPEITVILRKIENPVPMYARDTRKSRIEIPVIGKDIGFDLTTYDWVFPYGKGIQSDFIFNLTRRFVAWKDQDSTLLVKFTNRFDGIQLVTDDYFGSEYTLPRYASETGFKDNLELYIRSSSKGYATHYDTNVKNTDNYFFRIRSEEKDGKFVRAMYGKIVGTFDFSTVNSKTATISFKYYLNPDYSRNLEFDPTRNLFLNLPDYERVRIK